MKAIEFDNGVVKVKLGKATRGQKKEGLWRVKCLDFRPASFN